LIAEKLGTYNNIHNEAINLFNLGSYYLHFGGRPEIAHSYFEKSLQIFPGHWQSWHYLILSKIVIGRISEAEVLALKLTDEFPNNDYFKYALGLCYLKQNKLEQCKQILHLSLRQTSRPGVFFKILGALHYYERDFAKASKYWNMVLLNEPKNFEVLLALMETYHRMSKDDDRNRTAEILLCLKGNKTWNEYITEAANDNSLNAYVIRPSILLPVIKESLRDISF